MSSMAERLRARSEKRPMYTLDESDDEFLLPVSGSKGKKKEDGKRKDEGRKRDKDDDFLETEKIEKFVRDDAKEDACQKCGQPDKLVSCATCTYKFHKKCMFPPYKLIDDKWSCPECDPRLKEVEKILDCETRTVEDNAEGSLSGEKQKHYLVKWKGLSYIHCTWVSESEFTKSALVYPRLKQRLNTFHRHFESVDKFDDEWAAIRPEWTAVDRIIATRKGEDGTEYFVKWNELTHDECTWETEADISAFKPQIERFRLIQSRRKRKSLGKTKSIIRDMHAFEGSPKFLSGGKLHPYQLEGLNFLRFSWLNNRRVILADEMGLGKTIQSIAFLASLHEDNLGPHLVVAPLSTLRNWEREFATWAPHMNVVMYAGSGTSRETIRKYEFYYPKDKPKDKLKKNINKKKKVASSTNDSKQSRLKFDVLLTSYEMINMDSTNLKPIHWECMIVDEGHRLKNKDSKLFGQLKDYNTNHRVLLTGTPIQNNLEELFMLMHFLEGESFGSIAELQEEFRDINQDKQIDKLHGMLKPHLLRRFKKDVMKELPPKKELILRVELTSKQKEYYKAILTRNYQVLARRGGPQISLINVVMELRKLCCHAFMLEGVEPEAEAANLDEGLRRHFDAAGKMELLDKMMVKLKEQGHRVLIYSQFQHMLDLLEDYMALRKWNYERIDGKIAGAERQIRIDRFNAKNSSRFCFLLSTRAGGLGINLATADTVIIYDSDWNPHADLQAMARAHRLGQTGKVMIYRLVSRGTIEERMMQLTKKKMVLEHLVVGRLKAQAVNQEELDDIIRHGSKELFDDDDNEEGKSKHIHYDDTAIDRLLDRDQIIAEEQLEEEVESDFLKGFKVASFEFVDEAKAAAAREESRRQAEKASRANYWEELLKDKFEVQKVEEHTSMGKGKRSRKQMAATDDDGLAQDISSEDEDYADDEDGSDNDADVQGAARRGAYSRKKTRDPHPLMEGEGKSLRVLGFNLNQRNNFMQILMRFGFQDFQWKEFIPRLKGKSDSEIKDYAALVMQHLLEPLNDSLTFSDGVPKDQYRVDDVLVRLANLQLIEEKVDLMSEKPSDSLFPEYVYNEYPSLIAGSHWKKEHDLALLTAFSKHGYARYVPIVEDRENGIAECASKELNLTIPSVNGSLSANGVQSGDGPSSSNGNVDASKVNQVGPEYHYHYAQRKMVDFIRKRYQILEKALNLEYAVVTAKIPIPEPETQPRNQEAHLQPPSVSTTSVVNELPVLEPIHLGDPASDIKTEQSEAVKLYNKMSRIVQESDGDAVQAHMGDKNACVRLGNSLINLEAVCGDVCKVLEDKKPEVVSPETVQADDNGEAGAPEVKKEAPQVKDGVKAEAQQVGDGSETEALQVGDKAEAEAPEVKSEVVSDDVKDEVEPMEE
ncbi:chromatin remodeling factor CHD3 (PICKLE) isoform X4 [Carex rostrata]